LRIAGIRGGEPSGDRQSLAVGRKRLGELAQCHQRIAHLLVYDRQIVLQQRTVTVRSDQPFGHGERVAVGLQRLLEIAKRKVGIAERIQHLALASLQRRIVGGRRCQLLECGAGGLENLAD
jgi:hypothetical protein